MKDAPVVVAGGGIAGLATAIALARNGIEVKVCEKSRQMSEIGAGLQLGPNAVHALRTIGAWEAVQPYSTSPPEIHIRNGLDGEFITRVDLGGDFQKRFGGPYRVCHRADLHGALLQVATSLQNIEIHKDCEVTGADEIGAETAKRMPVPAQAIIATDGVRSRMRQFLYPESVALEMKMMTFRTMIRGFESSFGVELDCVNLWLFPGSHLVHYPVGRAGELNVVAASAYTEREPSKVFDECHPALGELTSQIASWTIWPVLYAPEVERWHDGFVCLAGDAAHGTAPFLAQGAAMALEDAEEFSRLTGSAKSWEWVFSAFETARRPRAQLLDRRSRRMATIYHLSGIPALARNFVLSYGGSSMILDRMSWLYGHSQRKDISHAVKQHARRGV